MSRSKHQRHSMFKGCKHPRTILGSYIKDGYEKLVFKHIKLKPYGRKIFTGQNKELHKYGEYSVTHTCKKAERRNSKKLINNELEDYVDNSKQFWESIICGNCIYFDRNYCQKHHKEVFILTPGCDNFFS